MDVDAIRIRGLEKRFGATVALDGVDLSVRTGEVHGFLGPNGAGKSTTIRVLLGLLRRDAGEVEVLGGDPWRDAVDLHRRLAYVPGDVHLWPTLTGGEAIDLLCALRGGTDRARRDELIERFQLDPTKRCSSYSKGNRQKVALIAGFASDVELFVLDEPTSGLDPLMETVFQAVVGEVRLAGRTVLLSSHILAEAEKLCDRVSIIREGRIVESGTLDDLRHLTRTSVSVRTRRAMTELPGWPGVHDPALEDDGHHARFEVDTDHLGAVIARLSDLEVVALTSTPPTLEELFLRHYGDEEPSDTAGGTAAGAGVPAAVTGETTQVGTGGGAS
jgi:ABC-2 type transport system ATP-binding protein